MHANEHQGRKIAIGWQEWCALPQLNLGAIKAKIDTGAKTSAIQAFDIKTFNCKDGLHVRFALHPLQAHENLARECSAKVVDQRWIMSSNGHKEHRYVIQTLIIMAGETWEIELTLSDRDPLKFRLLLGRTALKGRVIIDPSKKFCLGRLAFDQAHSFYRE
jgi:hypothetical protein